MNNIQGGSRGDPDNKGEGLRDMDSVDETIMRTVEVYFREGEKMKDNITLRFTKEELSYLLIGAYLSHREYRDSQNQWPHPPAEVARECSDHAYSLYRKIKKAYDDASPYILCS